MSGQSIAQQFSADVLNAVIRFMAPASIPPFSLAMDKLPLPRVPRVLLPLLGVCRAWRHVGCSLFYRLALCGEGPEILFQHNLDLNSKLLLLRDATRNRCQHYIRAMVINITVSSLLTPSMNTIKAVMGIRQSGELQQVQRVCIVFELGDSLLIRRSGKQYETRMDSCAPNIARNCRFFTECIREYLPGLCRIDVDFRMERSPQKPATSVINRMMAGLDGLVTPLPFCISEWYRAGAEHFSYFVAPSLQSITVSVTKEVPGGIDLIRSQAQSLVCVCITQCPADMLVGMFIEDEDGPDSTTVYPQLKQLVIGKTNDPVHPTPWKTANDPLPRLEMLKCQGTFPLFWPAVLANARSHIRKLDIGLDTSDVACLRQIGFFEPGSFECLTSLCCNATGGYSYDDAAGYILQAMMISNSLESMALMGISTLDDGVISQMQFPHTLRRLDLHQSNIYIPHIVSILSKCPQLQWACVCPDLGLNDVSHIVNESRGRYTLGAVGVRYMVIRPRDSLDVCEDNKLIPALAGVVSSLVCVTICRSYEEYLWQRVSLNAIKNDCVELGNWGQDILERVRFQIDERL